MIVALQTLVFFRQTLLEALDRFLRPYYKKFFLAISKKNENDSEEEEEDHVFADYDDEKGVVFYPPMYAQRYAAISDCLLDERWCGKLEKVVDLGYHDMSFIKYLKDVPGIKQIYGVDLETIPLRCSSDLFEDNTPKRENPLRITLFQGNAADPDYRLIGCDAVVAIEMIEHMLPHDLERLVHTVFGFIKPWVAVFTTPNADFNVLFKSLEKNNYRRLDHLFEWTREQFNDWCSNIVVRYSDYTVNCKGIGPGPSDTQHLGCCSQMAVFVAKKYQKQQELDPNSLALIANAPEINHLSLMNWESKDSLTEDNNQIKESPELVLSEPPSHHSVMFASTMATRNESGYRDVIAQCNLDGELAKNFLMFEDDFAHHIVVPRKNNCYRVYLMEDVTRRLNCSTFQVKKFSKTTQNLMAKNKMDHLAHTREVIDEIKHLTNMLNFKKSAIEQSGDNLNVWFNINWGENAPYWNQYYKVVRDYSYPFETKSDETRILDLIYDELNRLIDMQYESETCTDPSKLEIPIEHLMKRVEHITTDVDKVKDLLDWNGYEIVNDVVIHSRLTVDNKSTTSIEDWLENDTLSDYETDTPSVDETTDGCFNLPNMPGRYIRRAIDQKVRKLRSMMTADEDITSELDRVVCRLMKLALRTSRGQQSPPPTKWMHCKLFDLLTLTEKTIERRRQHVLDNYTLRAIGYGDEAGENEKAAMEKIKKDRAGSDLLHKYSFIVNKSATPENEELLYDEEISLSSSENTIENDVVPKGMSLLLQWHNNNNNKCNSERTEAWVNDDAGLAQYLKGEMDSSVIGDAYVEQCISNDGYKLYSQHRKCKPSVKYCTRLKKSSSRSSGSKHKSEHKDTNRHRHVKKVLYPKFNHIAKGSAGKISTTNVGNFKSRTSKMNRSGFRPNLCKPIPDNLIKLCSPKYVQDIIMKKISDISKKETEVKVSEMNENYEQNEKSNVENDPKTTELSQEIERPLQCSPFKITETNVETDLAQTRTLIEDPDQASRALHLKHIKSHTIFLYDINEPSTSKGCTHHCMDAQCGPDDTSSEYLNNAATLHMDVFNENKIGNSIINTVINRADFGTSMSRNDKFCRTIIPKIKSVGIIIKDSDLKFSDSNNRSTITNLTADVTTSTKNPTSVCAYDSAMTETELVNVNLNQSKPEYMRFSNENKESIFKDENYVNLLNCSSYVKVAPESYLSSLPKPLETNLANSLMTRLKLCYSGIRIRSFKSKQEYQGAFPDKLVMPAQLLSERTPHIVQRKTNANNHKQGIKMNYVISKDTKNIKNYVISGKNAMKFRSKKPMSYNKNEGNEIRKRTKEVQIRNPKLTITKPKPINEMYDPIKAHAVQSAGRQIRPNNITKKVQSKKGVSTDLSKNKPNIEKTKKKVLDIKKENYTKNRPVSSQLNQKIFKHKINAHNLNKSVDTVQSNKFKNSKIPTPLKKAKTEEIKRKFSKMQPQVFSEFYVYQSETKSSVMKLGLEKDPNVCPSPQSVESSTCSSPASIETVKLRPKSVSSNSHSKIRILSPDSKSITSIKSKISQKNFRKFSFEKYEGNKENDVHRTLSSEKSFLGNKSKVFIAKFNSTPLQATENCLIKRKSSKSVKKYDGLDDQKDSFVINKPSLKSIKFEHIQALDQDFEFIKHDNSLLDYPRSSTPINEEAHSICDTCHMNANVITDLYSIDVITPLLAGIIESSLGILDSQLDTQPFILEQNSILGDCIDDSLSLSYGSVKTAVENLDFIKEHDGGCDLNSTYNTVNEDYVTNNTLHIVPEAEVLTFHPQNSLSDSFQNTSVTKNEQGSSQTHRKESILDLFERKNALSMPGNAGPLALQAFSGFSVNTEPIPGDQPNYVNHISSATGSGTNDNRQATSEELFVSGRSSLTYATCSFEEDPVIPEWLFQIVNHQQIEQEQASELGPAMLPIAEPMYDINGIVVDPAVGSEAGAGDGRGVHSDMSQDSSGQGSSITSSDTSSGPHSEVSCAGVSSMSEALLIDPSMLTGQYTTALPLESNSASVRSTQESTGNVEPPRSSREVHHDTMALLGASDADADESSLDTDAE